MALCSQADLEALRQDIANEPGATVAALIRHAEGLLEGWSGRIFQPETVTWDAEELPYADGAFYLPHFPVDPETVVVNAPDATVIDPAHYSVTPSGVLRVLGYGSGVYAWDWQYHTMPRGLIPWRPGTTITYTGGATDPDEVPQALRTLCAQVVVQLFDRAAAAAEAGPGIISEGLGGWNVTYAQMTEDDLTPGQRRILRRYAHQVPVITI